MRAIAILCLFVPALAWAHGEPAAFPDSPAHLFAASLQSPARADLCHAPVSGSGNSSDVATHVSAHILADGSVADARIVSSSGQQDLDRAALACVETMHVAPKTANGIPVDVDWQLAVDWPDGRVVTAPLGDHAYQCDGYYPPTARRDRREGDTLVSFVIGEDGMVSNIAVVESSGDRALDAATVECVSEFRYHPAMRDGKPVEIDGNYLASWRAR